MQREETEVPREKKQPEHTCDKTRHFVEFAPRTPPHRLTKKSEYAWKAIGMASKKEECAQFCIRQSLRKKNARKRAFEEKHEAKKKWRQKENEEPLEVERCQDEKENGVGCGMENLVLAPGCHDKQKQNKMKNVKEGIVCLPVPPMNSVPQLSRRISKRQSIVDPSYSPKISPVVATRLDVFYVEKNVSMAKSQRKKSQKKKESSQTRSM